VFFALVGKKGKPRERNNKGRYIFLFSFIT